MIEPIFDLFHQPVQLSQPNTTTLRYNDLLQTFVNQNYGYYTDTFIRKIVDDAIGKYPDLLKYNLKKTLREISKELLITDLELVFMSHFLNLNQWNL